MQQCNCTRNIKRVTIWQLLIWLVWQLEKSRKRQNVASDFGIFSPYYDFLSKSTNKRVIWHEIQLLEETKIKKNQTYLSLDIAAVVTQILDIFMSLWPVYLSQISWRISKRNWLDRFAARGRQSQPNFSDQQFLTLFTVTLINSLIWQVTSKRHWSEKVVKSACFSKIVPCDVIGCPV